MAFAEGLRARAEFDDLPERHHADAVRDVLGQVQITRT